MSMPIFYFDTDYDNDVVCCDICDEFIPIKDSKTIVHRGKDERNNPLTVKIVECKARGKVCLFGFLASQKEEENRAIMSRNLKFSIQ